MTQSSPHELEKEAERRRAEMAETAEQLRAKLTPGQLVDEIAHNFRDGDMGKALSNLKTQVRDNPLALALVGAGMACLVAGIPGSSPRSSRVPRMATGGSGAMGSARETGGSVAHSVGAGLSGAAAKVSSTGASIGDGVSSGASSVAEAGQSAARAVGDGLSSVGEGVARAGSTVGDGLSAGMSSLADAAGQAGGLTRDGYRYLEDEISGLLEREPLVLGAIGLAIGAAAGALVPRSRFEEEHLGAYESEMRDAGMKAAKSAVKKAGAVASAVGSAAMDEANRQGLAPEPGEAPLAERLGKVAERGLDEARQAVSAEKDQPPSKGSASQAPSQATSRAPGGPI